MKRVKIIKLILISLLIQQQFFISRFIILQSALSAIHFDFVVVVVLIPAERLWILHENHRGCETDAQNSKQIISITETN